MSPIVHVVGAGVAGLAAAHAAARAGGTVRLYEATDRAGGRCAAVQGGHDNGTHVLLGANRAALSFLRDVGAGADWIEPEPEGVPLVDLTAGTTRLLRLSPGRWWSDPPPGFGPAALVRLARLLTHRRDRPVSQLAGEGTFSRALLTPLTLAALNTPPAAASSRTLAVVLRRLLQPGAGRLLVARDGLGPNLVEPALRSLAAQGVERLFQHRLRRLAHASRRVTGLGFGHVVADVGPGDLVVLAVPAHAAARLLPSTRPPDRFEPIVNAHFTTGYAGRVRFVGLIGGVGQWVLFRPGMASVTISAARAEVGWPAERVFGVTGREVERAAEGIGLALGSLRPHQVIKERRATPSHPPGRPRPVPRRPLANLVLAGDWLSPLPATIEAAVSSGRAAAMAAAPRRGWRRLAMPAASSA